jgi:hypothetical protein
MASSGWLVAASWADVGSGDIHSTLEAYHAVTKNEIYQLKLTIQITCFQYPTADNASRWECLNVLGQSQWRRTKII